MSKHFPRSPVNPLNLKLPFSVLYSALLASAAAAEVPPAARESIEWCDIWIAQANKAESPRVLLIGDSITKGYSYEVEKLLKDEASVARLATSAFITDPMLLQTVTMMLDTIKFDVVVFNNGMHGWQHSEEEYREGFPGFLTTIQKHAKQAKLIWANTTPLKESKLANQGEVRPSDDRIAARNAIARQFVEAQGIPIVDLNSLMAGHPEYHSDNIHFNAQGTGIQANQVTAEIRKLLKQ